MACPRPQSTAKFISDKVPPSTTFASALYLIILLRRSSRIPDIWWERNGCYSEGLSWVMTLPRCIERSWLQTGVYFYTKLRRVKTPKGKYFWCIAFASDDAYQGLPTSRPLEEKYKALKELLQKRSPTSLIAKQKAEISRWVQAKQYEVSHAVKNPNENFVTLQRSKSLTERSRMVTNKLSRLSTPSPVNTRASRSSLPHIDASSSASSSSAPSSHSHSHSHSAHMTRQYDGALSGSETERESSSSPERSSTPASISAQCTRDRCTSASSSPIRQREPSPGPLHGPRKRVSMAGAASFPIDHASYDVTSAALAAVNDVRGNRFPENSEMIKNEIHVWKAEDSYTSNANPQYSLHGAPVNLSSTVRDLTCRHQTRQLSDDISTHPDSCRRQTQRGGSAESSLGAGGRLVGEGLRAAGIVEWEDEDRVTDDRSRASGSSTRHSDGAGPSARLSDPSRVPPIPLAERDSRGGRTVSSRPATSMGEFYDGDDGNTARGMTFSLRSKGQILGVERDRQLPGESPKNRPLPLQQTPAAPTPPEIQQQSSEHTRLTLEMFENISSRLPNQSAPVSDLFRSAETILLASEKLNALEQQIDAEVDDETRDEEPASEIWRRVGGEYRESLRVSDEVVRTITGFLLGVGKVVKEASAGALNDSGQPHSRTVNFDNEEVFLRTPELDSENLLQGPHMVLENGYLWSAQHLLLSIVLLTMWRVLHWLLSRHQDEVQLTAVTDVRGNRFPENSEMIKNEIHVRKAGFKSETNTTRGNTKSSLGAGGRLVGEGLYAASIANDPQVSSRRTRTTASSTNRIVEWEDENRISDGRSRASGSSTRHSDGAGPSARPHLLSHRSRVPPILLAERDSRGGRTASPRPATSMAEFYHGDDGNTARGMIFSLRSKRQVLGVERDRQPPEGSPKNRPLHLQQTQLRLLHQKDLFRSAETIVLASDKLNALLRAGTNRGLEQQMWIMRHQSRCPRVRSGGELEGSTVRTCVFDNEEVSRRTPEVDRSSSRRSQDGRRSVESRRSWDPSASSVDLSRRISSRAEGVLARPPSSRERDLDLDQPSSSRNSLPPPPLSATRRLFTPREHREQQITSDSIDLSLEYEPSPTPATRNVPGGRHRPIPALAIPPPLPTLPSESLLHKGNRRKPSTNTIRGLTTPFPLPSANPTTAVTTHTVSNSPESSTFPVSRTYSQESVRTSVTFSRPSEVSLSALQQQHVRDEARRRVTSSSSAAEDEMNASPAPSPAQVRTPLSGSETERDTRRRTIGVRAARASLDSIRDEREGDNGGSQSRTVTLPSQRRERRRTVTEVFA
ncbi:hypothetical protein K503DRAFT_859165 [Rhizopogon vinicolor AM-OR11-026]|uniref:Uncharacterized protein n=1 Tax=Rhizopogon vinicolor AM-OR11-026 TaxID=1314800 RepID=A0A1B7MPH3_9AGAM|nr:hypothetical protein K503DRAFT_859165 [Rhizopogon vinicolor AM-OR11-026]